jgi:hypothetical protein
MSVVANAKRPLLVGSPARNDATRMNIEHIHDKLEKSLSPSIQDNGEKEVEQRCL